jgi:flagellar basal-body rod modification protein FlgD
MTIPGIDPTGPLAYLNDKPAIAVPDNKRGKDAFLKLLVAQMKYQNPMEPTDSSSFITQSAQFTLVEQMENVASANADMLAGQLNSTAASLVGKAVQWDAEMSDDPESPGNGIVQGVRVTADGPVLIVDGWDVPLARVIAFGEVPSEEPGSTVTPPPETTPPVDETESGDETSTPPVDEAPVTESEPDPATDPEPTPDSEAASAA